MNWERGLLHRRIVSINNILPLVQHLFTFGETGAACQAFRAEKRIMRVNLN